MSWLPVEGAPRRPESLDAVVHAAKAEGLLPATALLPPQDPRPWPVLLLTALGAWLAALPLLGALGLFLGGWMREGVVAYGVAALVLAAAVKTVRLPRVPLFVEQLAVPCLGVGGGLLAYALLRDLPLRGALVLMVGVAAGLAAVLPRAGLRMLLGAGAALFTAWTCVSPQWTPPDPAPFWLGWHLCVACWGGALGLQHRMLAGVPMALPVRWAAAVESFSTGWAVTTLAGLAWWSGMTFLVGASAGGGWAGAMIHELGLPGRAGAVASVVSALLMAAAAGVWGHHWPGLRQLWVAGLVVVGLVLAWFLPALGAVTLVLACSSIRAQWRLAGAAALAAVWILGSFYYALAWTLASKAGLLVLVGAVLGLLAWVAWRGADLRGMAHSQGTPLSAARLGRAGVVFSAGAVLVVVNVGIWQKEMLIRQGTPVYVALAPVDPRSLMQGDYMQLSVRLPDDVQTGPEGLLSAQRPCVVARRDARGVATLLRLDSGAALAADELRIELTPKNGRWVLVSDAWFFKEGEAERWARARYAEFRVHTDGQALLVGLRGADLQSL